LKGIPLLEWKYLEEKMNVIIELNDLIHFYECSLRLLDEKLKKMAEEQETIVKFKRKLAEKEQEIINLKNYKRKPIEKEKK